MPRIVCGTGDPFPPPLAGNRASFGGSPKRRGREGGRVAINAESGAAPGTAYPLGRAFPQRQMTSRFKACKKHRERVQAHGHRSCAAARMRLSVLVDQAAELLGVSRRTVYYRIRDGRLRTIRTRCGSQRVLLESIEALLRKNVGPPGLRRSAAASGKAAGSPVTGPGADASSTGPCARCPTP